MQRWRVLLAVVGVALTAFGALRLVTQVPFGALVGLAVWLVLAVVIHDAVIAPLTVGVGLVVHRLPARGRRYVQGALVAGSLITVIAIPLIIRHDSQPVAKAILRRDYVGGLALLLALVAVVALVAYLLRVRRERSSRAE